MIYYSIKPELREESLTPQLSLELYNVPPFPDSGTTIDGLIINMGDILEVSSTSVPEIAWAMKGIGQ